jgi:hypothetical protein
MRFGSFRVKTPRCRSRALLRRVTSADHSRGALRDAARIRGARRDVLFIAARTKQRPSADQAETPERSSAFRTTELIPDSLVAALAEPFALLPVSSKHAASHPDRCATRGERKCDQKSPCSIHDTWSSARSPGGRSSGVEDDFPRPIKVRPKRFAVPSPLRKGTVLPGAVPK